MKYTVLSILVLWCATRGVAQDSLRVTLTQADDLFRKSNFQLLVSQLGIDENKAYEVQAHLLPNPTVYVETMPINTQTNEFFPVRSSNAEQIVQYQQLVLLAGKRNKQTAVAKAQTQLAADRFYDLVRNLKYQLHSTFYQAWFSLQSMKVYDDEIDQLQAIVDMYRSQYEKGNVPLKDVVRLRAYLVNLRTERLNLQQNFVDYQHDMALLLGMSGNGVIVPVLSDDELKQNEFLTASQENLITKAYENRPDLKGFIDVNSLEKQNLTLQKAMAVPDLTLQGSYDRNGSFIPNYFGVGLGISLPFWNRNQGNIKAAEVRIKGSEVAINQARLQVEKDVQQAYIKLRMADQLYQKFDNKFTDDFARLMEGVRLNYQRQNLGVTEFIDFFDSYKTTVLQYNQLRQNRQQAVEDLSFAIGQ
ncbi:MAG: TolC family protein [Siphonobacter sp.]